MIQLSDLPSLYPHQLSLNQSRRKVFGILTSFQEPLCLALCPFAQHLAESDNNNKINFQQLKLREKGVQCFLSQKHRELECQPAISNTWKTLCSVPVKLMSWALKDLLVRYIVHHGNEVWGTFGPGTLVLVFWGFFSHISKGEKRQSVLWRVMSAVPITPVLHLCFTMWLNLGFCASTIVAAERSAEINTPHTQRDPTAK